MRAIRATVVVAGLFALTDKVIGNLQMATFAAFGGFATLVLASFSGTRRDKLLAHTALALAGSALLTIGTVVSSSTAIAAIVTVPVTFVVFFAGVAGPNAASGVTGALLVYVLPAASTGTIAMVPDRLAGWWLASVSGTAAVLLLSPRAGADPLRAAAAKLASALADELDAALRGAPPEPGLRVSIAAKQELVKRFTATPYRPVGLNAPDQALANAVELLEWCTALIADGMHERSNLLAAAPPNRELLRASEAVLRDVATLLAGGDADPDLDRLERSRAQCLAWLNGLPSERSNFADDAQLAFHADAIAVTVFSIGGDALVASGKADPEWMAAQRRRLFLGSRAGSRALRRVSNLAAAARRDASVRSLWFINSLRGSVALAVAVAVADLSSVQHGFWVVLGTLSVLRTNAASTGSTAIRALGGTALGFLIGGALLLAIGTSSAALWVALPIAVFVAAYTPGTAPFAIGQAAFTVTVAVLFNLLVPVGWTVGVVRIEDVAIGCAVSVLVGGLFWPRGLSGVVGDDLADAFRSGASYLTQAVGWASGREAVRTESAVAAVTSASRLDDALRGYLAEQGSKRVEMRELWRLVGGSMRLRLTAHSITNLPRMPGGSGPLSNALNERVMTLASWYGRLAEVVGKPHERTVPALSAPALDHVETARAPFESRYGIWLDEHLDHLSEHLGELVPPALRVAEVRRKPWWR
jgi:Fusaric acid resistance protein-like